MKSDEEFLFKEAMEAIIGSPKPRLNNPSSMRRMLTHPSLEGLALLVSLRVLFVDINIRVLM